jgi:hypothetical protein
MHLHRSKNYKLFSDPLTYILYDSTDSEFIKFVTYNLRVSHRAMLAAVNIRRMFNTEFIGSLCLLISLHTKFTSLFPMVHGLLVDL